jgi:hypothetical protein
MTSSVSGGRCGFDDIAKLLERDSHIFGHHFEVIVDALRWRTPHRWHDFSQPVFPADLYDFQNVIVPTV